MKFYLAPMEGITGYIYRNGYEKYFAPPCKYFTPFIAANSTGKFSSREWEDICPQHNEGKSVVPQLLTNKSEDFIATSKMINSLGYTEINLNLGCPSGTVVAKNRGSGFLSQPESLNRFLDDIFSELNIKISIKTRIGKDSPEEFNRLMNIFNQYPIEELIIHPRIQKDYYKNSPNMDVFKEAFANSKMPVCYNGDIFTKEDYNRLLLAVPDVGTIMLGRGLIANPGLIMEINNNQLMTKKQLRGFHDYLFENYCSILSGERNVLFKMKELWFYMIYMFTCNDKYAKKIRKAQHFSDYVHAVDCLFEEQDIVKSGGLFKKQ